MDSRLIVNTQQMEQVIREAEARGDKITYPPKDASEWTERVQPAVESRWSATRLRFVALDGALGELWDDCLNAYLVSLDVAAMSLGIIISEGLLRAALYRVCESRETPEGAVDTELDSKITKLTLKPLAEKARKLGLISDEDERFLKDSLAPLRNPTQHGNSQQLLRDLLGDHFEFQVDKINIETGEQEPTTVTVADAKWLTGSVLRAIALNKAPDVLDLCCKMSQHLDRVIADIPEERLPLDW